MMSRRLLPSLMLLSLMGCAIQLPSVQTDTVEARPLAGPRLTATGSPNQGRVSTLALDLSKITNIAVDDQDNLYLVKLDGIDKITPNGATTHFLDAVDDFENPVDDPTNLTDPGAIAVAQDGTTYVWVDSGRLFEFAPSGKRTSVMVGLHDRTPPSLAVDAHDNVYASLNPGLGLPGDHDIVKVTPAGDVSVFAGRKGGASGYADGPADQALFNQPGALAFDGEGNLYVADMGNQVIRRISPDGMVSSVVAWSRGDAAWGVPDGIGGAAWAPPSLGVIIHTAPGFSPPPSPSPHPIPAGSFSYLGLTLDRAGNLYFTAFDNRIHRLAPDGTLSVFAGDGRQCDGPPVCNDDAEPCQSPDPTACEKDGPALQAEFALPTSIVANSRGALYVLDTGNGWTNTRLRVIR